jgi:hypothetical protein
LDDGFATVLTYRRRNERAAICSRCSSIQCCDTGCEFSLPRHSFLKEFAMTQKGDASPADGVNDMERLKMLFEYTKFHIGLYGTLVAALIAFAGSKFADPWQRSLPLVWVGIVAILVAGWAGGVIAGTLPQRMSFADF